MTENEEDRAVLRRVGIGLGSVSRIIAIWAVVYGALVLIQGDAAWGNRAYDVMQMLPGAPQTIGAVLVVSGIGLYIFESFRPRVAGVFAAMIGLCTCWIGAGFFLADIFVDGVSPLGQSPGITYAMFFTPIIWLRSYSLIRDRV